MPTPMRRLMREIPTHNTSCTTTSCPYPFSRERAASAYATEYFGNHTSFSHLLSHGRRLWAASSSSSASTIRQPSNSCRASLVFDPEFDISFRHPAYKDPSDILMILPGLDHPQGGIHHHTALAACAIVANNRFDGWFTEDREGKVPVNIPSDGILRKRDYYSHVTSDYKELYPIVPNFAHWEFPHNRLPSSWKVDIPRAAEHPTPRQSSLNEVILSRDTRCRITNHIEGTECAHLVPRSEKVWFEKNLMARYGRMRPGLDFIDNPRNVILLRSDIHTSFDFKRFAFVPKPASAAPSTTSPPTTASLDTAPPTAGPYTFVTHIFSSLDPHELTCLYHNVALQPLTSIVPEYLFARFAWTIFPFVSMFLQAGILRRLVMYESTTSTDLNSSNVSKTKTFTGEECRLLPLRSKSRNVSPKKRKPPDDEEDQDDGDLEGHDTQQRGRRRRRSDVIASSLGPSFGSEHLVDGRWYVSSSEEEDSGTETDISEAELQAEEAEELRRESERKRRCVGSVGTAVVEGERLYSSTAVL